ncbi:hypothetical protein [Lentzea sp. NPDC004782]|uniref:hypothetical protein n=1 Tax=Lentzea sp. NPDC004782 TaxID=3154458 RepID=UPI0033B71BC0
MRLKGLRAWFGEIRLPVVRPGSTVMPGKINPVVENSIGFATAYQIFGRGTW